MKRLVTSLLLIPLLAFGMSDRRKQTAPTPTNTSTLDLATGQLTTSDYSGQSQSAAGNSRIADTGASTVATAFAQKSDPTTELAWFDINRAAEDQPDVAIDLALSNEHKDAVNNLKSITASGNPTVAALNLATEALRTVKAKIEAREREKAARGKADTSAFRATGYLQGPGAVSSVAVMAGTMGAAVANGNQNRATLTSDISSKVTDITSTNDWNGVATILKHQLELAKINLEYERIKAANQKAPEPGSGKPPVVKPTDPKPVDPVPAPAPVGGFSCVPKFHTGDEMAHANSKTTPRESPKLPTDSKFRYIGNRDLGQGDYTAFIPADRPLLKAAEIRQGSKIICPSDIQWAPSQNRQRLIFVGAVPDGRATLACAYVDGGSETFVIEDLNGEQNSDTPAYKRNVEPVDPAPSQGTVAKFAGTTYALILPQGIRPVVQPDQIDFFTKDAAAPEGLRKIGKLAPDGSGFWATPREVDYANDIFELLYANGSKDRPFYSNGNLQIWANGTFRVPGSSRPATE